MKMRAITSELASVFCNLFASNSSCSYSPGFSKFPCKIHCTAILTCKMENFQGWG